MYMPCYDERRHLILPFEYEKDSLKEELAASLPRLVVDLAFLKQSEIDKIPKDSFTNPQLKQRRVSLL